MSPPPPPCPSTSRKTQQHSLADCVAELLFRLFIYCRRRAATVRRVASHLFRRGAAWRGAHVRRSTYYFYYKYVVGGWARAMLPWRPPHSRLAAMATTGASASRFRAPHTAEWRTFGGRRVCVCVGRIRKVGAGVWWSGEEKLLVEAVMFAGKGGNWKCIFAKIFVVKDTKFTW